MRERTYALRVVTTCASLDALVAEYEPYVDGASIFIPHRHVRAVGTEIAFSIRLCDRTPVLRGVGVVTDAWSDDANPFGQSGMRIAIGRIAPQSRAVYARLRPRRTQTTVPISALSEKTVPTRVLVRHLKTEREAPLPRHPRRPRPAPASLRGMRPITHPGEPLGVPVMVIDQGSSVAVAVGIAPLVWRWWVAVLAFAIIVAMWLLR